MGGPKNQHRDLSNKVPPIPLVICEALQPNKFFQIHHPLLPSQVKATEARSVSGEAREVASCRMQSSSDIPNIDAALHDRRVPFLSQKFGAFLDVVLHVGTPIVRFCERGDLRPGQYDSPQVARQGAFLRPLESCENRITALADYKHTFTMVW